MKKNEKKPSEREQIAAYNREALSWETSRVIELQKSRKVAWIIAGVSVAVTGAAVLAVAALVPLKTVQPYVIRVDSASGLVDVPRPLTSAASPSEAIDRYFVDGYVTAREAYDRDIAEQRYEQVGLMSDSAVGNDYRNFFVPTNPGSPLNTYGQNGYIHVKVLATNFISKGVAYVEYQTEAEKPGDETPTVQTMSATLSFKYGDQKLSQAQRAVNPLDFLVEHYSTSPMGLAVKETNYSSVAKPQASAPATAPGTAPIFPPPMEAKK